MFISPPFVIVFVSVAYILAVRILLRICRLKVAKNLIANFWHS